MSVNGLADNAVQFIKWLTKGRKFQIDLPQIAGL